MSKNNAAVVPIESRNGKIRSQDIKVVAEGITKNHTKAINAFKEQKNLILTGCPGTGKTFITLNLALKEALESSTIDQVLIVRSIVPLRDIGFLPGDKKEKCEDYESPYRNICAETFDANIMVYNKLKEQGVIDFQPTSFNQGITLHRTLIIVDEAQNLNYVELFNIMTRLGDESRIFFCGDYKKQDLLANSKKESSGFEHLINIINSKEKLKKRFERVDFTKDDCVRSDLVKDFIEADFDYLG